MMKRLLTILTLIGPAGCGPALPTLPTNVTSASSPASPPTSTPTPEPECPEPIEGTLLLRNEEMGYCFLYPDHLHRVDPFSTEVCLVPELPAMACHSNAAQIEVSDATGPSASEVADQEIALAGMAIDRSTTKVAGEEAVILHGVPAQDLLRDVLIVRDQRLYRLRFVLPDPTDAAAMERFDRLYATVVDSFTFLPHTE